MSRGRNPLPNSMKTGKILLDPKPLDEIPSPPDGLNEYAIAAWNELGELLVEEKILTKFDLDMLKHYAQVASLLKQFELYFASHEAELFDNSESKIIRKNPYVEQYLNIGKQLASIADHFGMSPKARGKVGIKSNKADKERDKLSQFLAGNSERSDEDINLD